MHIHKPILFGKPAGTPVLYHGVIRYNGSVQHIVWVGPLFLRTSNAKARANRRAAQAAR